MNLLLLFALLFATPAFAEITLDTEYLEEMIKTHPDDNETRVLLASYYLKVGELSKSQLHLNEALNQDKNNKNALILQKKWLIAKKYEELVIQLNISNLNDSQTVDVAIKRQYQEKNIDSLRMFFSLLEERKIELSKESQIIYATVLVETQEHEKALDVISLIPNQSDKRVQQLLAKACHAVSDMECAVNSLQSLFDASGELDLGLKLTDALLKQGRIIDARKVLETIKKDHKNEPKIVNLNYKINGLFDERVKKAEKIYQEKPTEANLKVFSNTLFYKGNNEKAYFILLKFIKQNPNNEAVKLFTAKRYASNRQYHSAISLLQSISKKTPENQLLLAKYISWSGQKPEKAQIILKDLLKQAQQTKDPAYTKDIVNDATLFLANTYLWKGNKSKAQQTLNALAKSEPSNNAIQEAYMLASKQYSPLIDRYEQQLKNKPKDSKLILRLANLYQSAKQNKKALQFYERYHKIQPLDTKVEKAMGLLYLTQKKYDQGFRLLKRNAYRSHTKKLLLNLANNYHWNGFNADALEVIDKLEAYYPGSLAAKELRKKVIKAPLDGRNSQLVIANKAYKKENYKETLPLFKRYLRQYPNDYFVRQRYAFALGRTGSYTKSANEFALLTRAKPDDLNVQYHYAYNLELSDNALKAEEIYKNIIYKTNEAAEKAKTQSTDNKDKDPKAKLNELANARLAILENNKDVVINGISLGGGVKKLLEPDYEVFSNSFVTPAKRNSTNNVYSSFVAEDVLYYSPRDTKRIAFEYQYDSDKIGVDFHQPMLRAQYNTWPYEVNFAGSGFRFKDDVCDAQYGGSVELSGMYHQATAYQFGGGLKIDQFDGKTEFSPFINSRFKFDKSDVEIQLYKRALFYDKLACHALKKHLNRYGAQVSGNIEFTKKQELWYSIDASYIDDSNVEVVPQFDFTVYQDKWINAYVPINYEITVDGYYMWNKRQTNDYYSPEFFDSTSIGFKPVAHLTKNFEVSSVATVGYSFDASSITYSYGLWAQYSINNAIKAKAGCQRSNIGSANAATNNYTSNNCLATLEYEWR